MSIKLISISYNRVKLTKIASTYQIMIESNYKQATRIIQKTERITNLPVRVSWDETLPVGSILHLSEMDWAKQLRISVNPNRPDIPYLVASQCGVALRFLKQKENKHLNSKKGSIEKTITEFIDLGYTKKNAEHYAHHLVSGVGRQLRGTPSQILLFTWIYREYPELRECQLNHCNIEVESSYLCLEMSKDKFPDWLLKSHQAMNGAFALAADYLFERNDLFEPFKKKGYEEICTGLVGDITTSNPDDPDTQLVALWLNRMSLNDEFEWNAL